MATVIITVTDEGEQVDVTAISDPPFPMGESDETVTQAQRYSAIMLSALAEYVVPDSVEIEAAD